VQVREELSGDPLPEAKPKPKRMRTCLRWARRVILALLLLASVGVFLIQGYISDPDRLARVASQWLSESLGAEVTIRQAHFGYDGLIVLQDVQVRVTDENNDLTATSTPLASTAPLPRASGNKQDLSQVVHVPSITLEHNFWTLLIGHFAPRRVVVVEPTFHVTEDLINGGYIFERLGSETDEKSADPKLPNIQLVNASVIFGQLDKKGQYERRAQMTVGGQFNAKQNDQVYVFDVRQIDDDGTSGIELTGQLDLDEGTMEAKLENLDAERHLRPAVSKHFRYVLDIYVNRKYHQRLIDKGLIQTTALRDKRQAERAAIKDNAANDRREELDKLLALPVFDLGGRLSAKIAMQRDKGTEQWETTVKLDIKGVNFVYSNWTWPMTVTSGQIVIEPGRILLDQLAAKGLTGGRFEVNGPVYPSNDDISEDVPEVDLKATGLPMDDYLLSSIPEPHDQFVRDFGIRGKVDVAGRIFRKPHQFVEYAFDGKFVDATAKPFEGEFAIEQLQGGFNFVPGKVTISKMTGRRGPGTFTLDADCQFIEEPHSINLRVSGQSVRLEDPLWDLIPPQLTARDETWDLFEIYKPQGLFDLKFDLLTKGSQRASFKLVGEPREASAMWHGQRVAFKNMSGKVYVGSGQVRLENIKGDYDAGTLYVSKGTFDLKGDHKIDLHLEAKGKEISRDTLALLAPGPATAIVALDLNGAYEITDTNLVVLPVEDKIRAKGRLKLTEATLNAGLGITDGKISIGFETIRRSGAEWPWVKLDVKADSLRAEQRLISPLSLNVQSDNKQPNVIRITNLKGKCYGGTVGGKADVVLGKLVSYRADLNIKNVGLAPFEKPEKDQKWIDTFAKPGSRPDTLTGQINASLKVRGTVDDASSKWGVGKFNIRNARIYELPVAMTALQLINFAPPTAKSFDKAAGDYVIRGDDVKIDNIELTCKTVRISGDGHMDYPTRKVDLLLFTHNTGGPKVPVISHLLDAFKDTFLSIHITGPLEKPSANVLQLRGAKRTWTDVFKNRQLKGPSSD